MTIKDTPIKCN